MSKIKLTGESSGYVEISAGNAAGNNTLEAPTSGTRLVAHEGSQDVTLNGNLTVNGVISYEDTTNIDSVGVVTARNGLHVTSGNVAIGHNNPLNTLHVKGPTGGVSARFTDAVNATVFVSHPSSGKSKIADAGGNYGFEFDTASVNILSGGSERLRITSAGVLQAAAGVNLQMASNGRIFVGNGGNATDPMFANVSDTNTGIAFPATDTMMFTTGGSERLRITSAGHVNIGGASPSSSALTVKMATNKHIGFSPLQSEVGNVPAIVAFLDNGSLTDLGMRGTTLRFATGSAERLRINSAGEVYIGSTTANGQGKLFVNDSSGATTTQAHIRNAASTGTAKVFLNLDDAKYASVGLENGSLVFRNSTSSTPTERLRIDSTGDVRFAGTNLTNNTNKNVNLTAPSYNTSEEDVNLVQVENESGFNQISFGGGTSALNAATTLRFLTASSVNTTTGTERLRISSDGALFVGEYSGSGRFVLHNADQGGGADTTYSKDKGFYVRNDCGPTHVDLTGVDNFTAKIHNGAYAGSGVANPQGTITKLLLHGCTYNGYNAYGSICLDVQNANSGRGDLVFLNGGNNTSTTEHLRITSGGTIKINPAELQTTAGDKFAQIKGGGVINTKRFATGHYTNTATYAPQEYGYIGDYMHYGCNAVYYLAQTSTGNSGYSSHMFSWYDSGHWGHYGKFVLMCQESGYIGGMAHRYLSGTTVTDIFGIGHNGSVSTTQTQTGSGTHAGQSVYRYDCTVSHTSTYRSMRWYLGVLHGCTLGVTGSGKSQSDCNTYANSNGSLLHLFGVSDSNLTMGPNYRTW